MEKYFCHFGRVARANNSMYKLMSFFNVFEYNQIDKVLSNILTNVRQPKNVSVATFRR